MLGLRNPAFLGGSRGYALGGTVSTVAGDRVHSFTSSGTLQVVNNSVEVQYLIVGGGGGGGVGPDASNRGGGGGAGGVRQGTMTLTPGSYTVTVGGNVGANVAGVVSSAFSLTAAGGGRGANISQGCTSGGSGGGGRSDSTDTSNTGGCSGTAGQGFGGGSGGGARGGGGGGSASAGVSSGGGGGNGIVSSINGASLVYAAGGEGSDSFAFGNKTGRANSGDGGSGGRASAFTGTGGQAGIVIVRYT